MFFALFNCSRTRENVKRIIPRRPLKKLKDSKLCCSANCCKNEQERLEWYHIYYSSEYNPAKETFKKH